MSACQPPGKERRPAFTQGSADALEDAAANRALNVFRAHNGAERRPVLHEHVTKLAATVRPRGARHNTAARESVTGE